MATLTPTIILQQTIEACRIQAPMLDFFAGGFTNQSLRCGQTAIAHLVNDPVALVTDCCDSEDPPTLNGGTQTNTLLSDVSIVMDKMVAVKLSLSRCNALRDDKKALSQIFANAARAVGKGIVDNILAGVLEARFAAQTIETEVNTDRDTLNAIRFSMNAAGAGSQRNGLVSGGVASALDSDPRIASNDYHGQRIEEDPHAHFRNLQGFRDVMEYTDFPGNNENMTGFFFDRNAIQFATAIPSDSGDIADSLGIPRVLRYDTVTDSDSGLTLQSVMGMEQNTEELFMVIRLLTGKKIGDELACHGHRLITEQAV